LNPEKSGRVIEYRSTYFEKIAADHILGIVSTYAPSDETAKTESGAEVPAMVEEPGLEYIEDEDQQ
jgi:hypothetical protein